VTQLVLAAPAPSRFGGLRRSSPLLRLLPLAATAGIDVHLIAPKEAHEQATGESELPDGG
jgi:hypothetical protein